MVLQARFFHVVDKVCDRLTLPDERAPAVARRTVLLIDAHTESHGLDKGPNELSRNGSLTDRAWFAQFILCLACPDLLAVWAFGIPLPHWPIHLAHNVEAVAREHFLVRDNLCAGSKFGYSDSTVATELNLKIARPSGRACFQWVRHPTGKHIAGENHVWPEER